MLEFMEVMNLSAFSDELDKEIEKRVEAMESGDHKYPPRFRKGDWIGFGVVTVISLISSVWVIIYGANM